MKLVYSDTHSCWKDSQKGNEIGSSLADRKQIMLNNHILFHEKGNQVL